MEEIQDSYIVTGGAIVSLLQGEMPNDFDLYFKNTNVCVKLANYYLSTYVKDEDKINGISKVIARPRLTNDGVEICIKSSGFLSETANSSNYEYFEQNTGSEDAVERIDNYFNSDKKKSTENIM